MKSSIPIISKKIMDEVERNAWCGISPKEVYILAGTDVISIEGYIYEPIYEEFSATSKISLNNECLYGIDSKNIAAYRNDTYHLGTYKSSDEAMDFLEKKFKDKEMTITTEYPVVTHNKEENIMAKHEKFDYNQSLEEMVDQYSNWRNDFEVTRAGQGIVQAPSKEEEYESIDIDSFIKNQEKESVKELMQVKNEVRNTPELGEAGKEMVNQTITLTQEHYQELLEAAQNAKTLEAQIKEIAEKQKEYSELLAKVPTENKENKEAGHIDFNDLSSKDIARAFKNDIVKTADKVKEAVHGYADYAKSKVIDARNAIIAGANHVNDKRIEYTNAVKDKCLDELDKAGKYFAFQSSRVMAEFNLKMEKHYEKQAEKLEARADYVENVAKSMNQTKAEIKNLFRALARKEREEAKAISDQLQMKISSDRENALQFRGHAASYRDKIEQHLERMDSLYNEKEMTIDDKIDRATQMVERQNAHEFDEHAKAYKMDDQEH